MKSKGWVKVAAMFALVSVTAVSLWLAVPNAFCYAQGGYEVVGGGGAPPPGLTSFSGKINTSGILTSDVVAKSADKLCQLTLDKGTKALDKFGNPLAEIIVDDMDNPPAPPSDASVIGLVYNFWPDGATFNPPITLTFTYDPARIPKGVAEGKLVVAVWDKATGKWIKLVSTVDPVTHTITAQISHFTPFTVMASTLPAAFTVTGLVITPGAVNVGETVTVSALVANTGDLNGSYKVTFKVGNVVVATKDVALTGGASQQVTFTTVQNVAGTYIVNIDSLSGTFTVKAPPTPTAPPKPAAFTASAPTISPAEVNAGESVTISTVVTNTGGLAGSYKVTLKIDNVVVDTKDVTLAGGASQKVTFTTVQDVAAVYHVQVDGQSGEFTVMPVPSRIFPWWWIAVGVVVVGLLVYFLVMRRRVA